MGFLRASTKKRLGQPVPLAGRRDLVLLHGFQQPPLAVWAACG